MKPDPRAVTVFTIGHSNLSVEEFLSRLQRHSIQAVADVRSSPYSQRNPQFNRELLEESLSRRGIRYVFLGEELGARRHERDCFVNGRAEYPLIARTPAFQRGLQRVAAGASKLRIVLMCAEREPLECHRCILVAPRLQTLGLAVQHILGDGAIENHVETERRLLRALGLSEMDLFASPKELIEQAYQRQGERIAYQEEATATDGGN